jgi:hypothetical protein
MEAFVYCWTDIVKEKLYVGYHKGTPDDGYVCSSKTMLLEYNQRPKDFVRQIIATGTHEDMVAFETTLLKSIDARNDDGFYNQHNGDGNFYLSQHTEETKEKLRGPKSIEHKQKMKDNHADFSGGNNPMYGRSAIKENKLRWYNNGEKTIYVTLGTQPDGYVSGRIGKKHKTPRSEEHKKKISEFNSGNAYLKGYKYEIKTCPHCGISGGGGNMTRHHFDNCRSKR